MGFDKHWQRINQLDKVIDLGLDDKSIKDFGKVGSLSGLLKNMRNLSLEGNLIRSWEQVVHLGTELKLLNKLYLSFMKLELPENLYEMTEFQTYNDVNEIITVNEKTTVFQNLKTLVLIGMDLTWEKINRFAQFFPNVEELVLCQNKCNDFENISKETIDAFKNIHYLNLDGNEIVSSNFTDQVSEVKQESHKLELLANFAKLKNLTMNNNHITRFESAKELLNLEILSIEQNGIKSGEILVDLSKCIRLYYLRILKNPISDIHSVRHVRNIAVGEIRTLISVNGTDLSKYDRKDFEFYYLNASFKEYFDLFNTSHEEYLECEFLKWVINIHPNVLPLLGLYDNPYPQIKDRQVLQENSMNVPIIQKQEFIS